MTTIDRRHPSTHRAAVNAHGAASSPTPTTGTPVTTALGPPGDGLDAGHRASDGLLGHDNPLPSPPQPGVGPGLLGFLATGHLAATTTGGRAALPVTGHDVASTSEAELGRLRASRDPRDQRLANTIVNARRAYADTLAQGGRVVVSQSPANGGQPVLTLVPPGFDPSKPARVHTHYHGWNSTVADAPGHGTRRTENMQDIQRRDPQTLFVLPECSNAPTRGAGQSYKAAWSNVSDQARTTDDALRAAGVRPEQAREHVVSAHSAGGKALHFAMAAHPDGSGLRADRLQLFDCFYGDWDQAVRSWAGTANGRQASRVEYFHGTNDNPRGLSQGLQRAFGDRFRTTSDGNHDRTVARHLDQALPD
ncbi:MAG: hypothetical protein ABIJ09_00260 [Pseudomonadota bacterium]